MRLEDIGFYTLSDGRAAQCSASSPIWRGELILTDVCNFRCPYCRGVRKDMRGTLSWQQAKEICDYLISEGLKNVRFSGGEPTLWPFLPELIERCRDKGVERIAISTNGSSSLKFYDTLIKCGLNDISISLDACCASVGDQMAGGFLGVWEHVIESIRHVSPKVYTTVGMVFTEQNVNQAAESVLFAANLGVSDIRVVPSAQYNQALNALRRLPDALLDRFPILRYRISNVRNERNVRTMTEDDCRSCYLALDDMAIAKDYHFPCIIYMREGGDPIGQVGETTRKDREAWVHSHDSWEDPICRQMCLDVCIDYNNKAKQLSRNRRIRYVGKN